MRHTRIAVLVLAVTVLFAACGDDDASVESLPTDDGAAAGACLAGDADCADTGGSMAEDPQLEPGDEGAGPSDAARCLPDAPDCEDTVVVDNEAGTSDDSLPSEDPGQLDEEDAYHREQAHALLGATEDELGPDVRIGRRGTEQYALTEDYVVGRMTVELEDDGSGTYVVVQVTVELNAGPEVITA